MISDCRLGFMTADVSTFNWFHPTLTYHTASHGVIGIHLTIKWRNSGSKTSMKLFHRGEGRDPVSCQVTSLSWITVRSKHHQSWRQGSYLSRQVGTREVPNCSLAQLHGTSSASTAKSSSGEFHTQTEEYKPGFLCKITPFLNTVFFFQLQLLVKETEEVNHPPNWLQAAQQISRDQPRGPQLM